MTFTERFEKELEDDDVKHSSLYFTLLQMFREADKEIKILKEREEISGKYNTYFREEIYRLSKELK